MAVSFGSNIASLGAIRRLADGSNRLALSFEKLSSGQRINRAADDAAGLAVSLSLSAKGQILRRGYLNAVDGLSVLTIADSAIGEVTRIYERMAELSEQAANGTLSYQQRLNLDAEYGALDQEIRRLAVATSFNGIALLQGEKSANIVIATGISAQFQTNFGVSADGRYAVIRAGNFDDALYFYDHVNRTYQSIGYSASISTNFRASMSQNGDLVYSSRETDQVYLRRVTGETIQLTNSLASNEQFQGLSISGDGRYVAFTSRTIYEDGGSISNPIGTGNARIYRMDVETGEVRAFAVDTGTISSFSLSNDGSKLVFRSSTNLLSQGDGFAEFYSLDFNQTQLNVVQVSNGTAASSSSSAVITDAGAVFFIDSRNLNGLNPSAVDQIYRYDPTSGALSTVTSETTSTYIDSLTLSGDGTTLHFAAASNMTGENPLLVTQAFSIDLAIGTTHQKTKYTTAALGTGLFSGDGRRFFFTRGVEFASYVADVGEANQKFDFEVGFGAAGRVEALIQGLRGVLAGLSAYTITTRATSLAALDSARANIEALAALRGQLGASSSRIGVAAALLTDQALEAEAARSRIRDVDIAEESAAVTRTRILQQVAAAVVGQANQQPQLALRLLAA